MRLRVTLQMTGGVNQFPDGYPTTVVERLVAGDEYTCRPLTFQDFDNVLRVGVSCVNAWHAASSSAHAAFATF